MPKNMLRSICLSLLAFNVALAQTQSAWINPGTIACELNCLNDGYCTIVEGTTEALVRTIQSGHLIEKCVCKPGFTGLACDQTVEQCSLPERTCQNGIPCSENDLGEWTCDCSKADELSVFAGYQCRKPATEYCTGDHNVYAALSFCTNGGRCVSDFLAADVTPGDATLDTASVHLGCKCPRDFYGPHCEFLKFVGSEQEATEPKESSAPAKSRFMSTILTLMSLSCVMLGALVVYKLKTRKVPREITIHPMSARRGYDDSRYNGRHQSYNSHNLHIDTVFEDIPLS